MAEHASSASDLDYCIVKRLCKRWSSLTGESDACPLAPCGSSALHRAIIQPLDIRRNVAVTRRCLSRSEAAAAPAAVAPVAWLLQ